MYFFMLYIDKQNNVYICIALSSLVFVKINQPYSVNSYFFNESNQWEKMCMLTFIFEIDSNFCIIGFWIPLLVHIVRY